MKTIVCNSKERKSKIITFFLLLFFPFVISASASDVLNHVENVSILLGQVYSYLVLCGVFIVSLLIFTYYKRKEEKEKHAKQIKSLRQVHFSRYSRHL